MSAEGATHPGDDKKSPRVLDQVNISLSVQGVIHRGSWRLFTSVYAQGQLRPHLKLVAINHFKIRRNRSFGLKLGLSWVIVKKKFKHIDRNKYEDA